MGFGPTDVEDAIPSTIRFDPRTCTKWIENNENLLRFAA